MDIVFQALLYGVILSAIYLPVALGMNLVFGVMRILNFAHGELFMLGGMFTWWLLSSTGIGFFPAVLGSVVIVVALGLAIERFLLRPMGTDVLACLIMSMGISLVLLTATQLIAGSATKHYEFPLQAIVRLGGASVSLEKLAVAALGLISVGVFYWVLQRTRLGRAIRAVAQDKRTAMLQGVSPALVLSLSMAFGTGLAAIAGGLYGALFGVEPTMGSGFMMFSLTIMTLGGLGSIEGTFFAGLLFGMVLSFVTIFVGATEAAMASIIVLYLALLVRPNGLFGQAREGML